MVERVTAFEGYDLALRQRSEQSEVADQVEHLVAHRLVGEAQGLQRAFGCKDDGVLERSAARETRAPQRFDFMREAERPAGSDLAQIDVGRDFAIEELRSDRRIVRDRNLHAKLGGRYDDQQLV